MNKIFEYIIVGPPEVGKTSLIIRYFDNLFLNISYNTIGFSMRSKLITGYANYDIKMMIYDTAGQERYFTLVTNFIKNKTCILLCFSLASSTSFEECKKYAKMINEIKDENTIVFLIGTFLDMKSKCKNINDKELEEFIRFNQYKYYEISSKTGEGIRELFDSTLRILVDKKLGKDEKRTLQSYSPNIKCC
jgi:small GTP-binding protein